LEKLTVTFGERLREWYQKPFSVDMTGTEWALFILLLIVVVVFWNIVLFRITDLIRNVSGPIEAPDLPAPPGT
jgi:hypothetical protein